jgi:hypothetical protein
MQGSGVTGVAPDTPARIGEMSTANTAAARRFQTGMVTAFAVVVLFLAACR